MHRPVQVYIQKLVDFTLSLLYDEKIMKKKAKNKINRDFQDLETRKRNLELVTGNQESTIKNFECRVMNWELRSKKH